MDFASAYTTDYDGIPTAIINTPSVTQYGGYGYDSYNLESKLLGFATSSYEYIEDNYGCGYYGYVYTPRTSAIVKAINVLHLSDSAFKNFHSLTLYIGQNCQMEVFFPLSDNSYASNTLAPGTKELKIYVPNDLVEDYKTRTNWVNFASYIYGYDPETLDEI